MTITHTQAIVAIVVLLTTGYCAGLLAGLLVRRLE